MPCSRNFFLEKKKKKRRKILPCYCKRRGSWARWRWWLAMGSPSSEISGTCGSQRPVPRAPLWCWAGCCSAGSRSTPRNCKRKIAKNNALSLSLSLSLSARQPCYYISRESVCGGDATRFEKSLFRDTRSSLKILLFRSLPRYHGGKIEREKESRICKTNSEIRLERGTLFHLLSPKLLSNFLK